MMREDTGNDNRGGYFSIEPTAKCDPYYYGSGCGSYIGTSDHRFTEMHADKFCGALGTYNGDSLYPDGYGVKATYRFPQPVTSQAGDFLPTARAITGYAVRKIVGASEFTSIRAAIVSSNVPQGLTTWNCQQASDNPATKGNIATAMIYKHNDTGIWSYVWVFTGGGAVYFASVSSSVPASLTWTKKI